MRLVFWQNCLSPHQLPYIVHLLDDMRVDEVVIVAGETVSDARKKMGWAIGMFDGLERCEMEAGTKVTIRYADASTRFIRVGNHSFYDVVRQKLTERRVSYEK